jgi:hypothetical protein
MTTIINGSSPSITFSDSTTQTTAGLPLTGGTLTGGLTLPSAGITFSNGSTQTQSAGLGSSGQTWQNLTGSRAASTTYTNSTGYPIMVSVSAQNNTNQNTYLYVNSIQVGATGWNNLANGAVLGSMSAIVPNGSTYSVTGSFNYWGELR